jgi:hypothetical protein
MTPKEKAEELVFKFYRIIPLDKMTIDFNLAKKCALIAVEEILELDWFISTLRDKYEWISYWQEVKQEIEEL